MKAFAISVDENTMKKAVVLLLIAGLALAGFWFWQQRHTHQLPENLAQSNGRLELERIDIASLYAGRVTEVLADEGDLVKEGDVLVVLDSAINDSRLAEAQAGQTQAQEATARANAQITAQQQELKVAQMELDNATRLHKENLVSDAEVARRRAQRDAAQAAVNASRAAKNEAKAAIARANALANAAQSTRDDMKIISPKDGRVAYRFTQIGSVIGSGSRVMSLLDPSDVSMNIFLPTEQVSRVQVGDEARIVLDGLDAVLPAKVVFVSGEAQFTPKAVETQTERAKLMFKVKLRIPPETALQLNGLLKGGMAGNGFVRLNSKENWSEDLQIRLPK